MKQIVLLFICIVFSFTAFAQEKKDSVAKKERKWEIGLLGGINYPTKIMEDSDIGGTFYDKGNVNYNTFLDLKINFSKHFFLSCGAGHFSVSGFYENQPKSNLEPYSFVFRYLTFPVGIGYKYNLFKKIKLDFSLKGEYDNFYFNEFTKKRINGIFKSKYTVIQMPVFAAIQAGVQYEIYKNLFAVCEISYLIPVSPSIILIPDNQEVLYSHLYIYLFTTNFGLSVKL